MILQATKIFGWEKLELWGHTHLALLSLFLMVCVLEVIFLKITTSARLFTQPHHNDPDYNDSGEYEEDIYYEVLSNYNDQGARRQMRYRYRQREEEWQQHHTQYSYNNSNNNNNYYNIYSDENDSLNNNNYLSSSTDVFRFVN